MKIKASKQRKILTSVLPPKDKEFLWLHQTDGKSVLKDFINGQWIAVGELATSSHTEDLEPYVPTTPTLTEDYVTRLALSQTLSSYVTTSNLTSTLTGFLKKLTAGFGIRISGETISFKLNEGTGIKFLGDTISVNLKGGKDISVSGNVISYTGTGTTEGSISSDVYNAIQTNVETLRSSLYTLTNSWLASLAFTDGRPTPTQLSPISEEFIWPENTGGNGSGEGYSELSERIDDLVEDIAAIGGRLTEIEGKGYIPGNWFKTINNTTTLYSENGGNINIAGGEGGSTVHIAEPGESTDDTNTLYFFTPRLLQGVALYNDLLQNGSVTVDGVRYTYHPGKFYHLYEDGSFDELQPIPGVRYADCNPGENNVYYNFRDDNGLQQRVLTNMKWYGELVIPHKILYAETSDTAYFSLQVTGPFFADNTDVTFNFNPNELKVELVNNINGVPTSVELRNTDSVRFTYDNYYITRYLLFKRKYTNISELESAKDIIITLNNGHSSTPITIKYGACLLFYKDGVLDPIGKNYSLSINSNGNATVNLTLSYFQLVLPRYASITFARKIKIDQSKYNLLYAKVINAPNEDPDIDGTTLGLKMVACRTDTVGGAATEWTSTSTVVLPQKSYARTRDGYGKSNSKAEYSMWGSGVITCRIREVRPYFRHKSNAEEYDESNPDMLTLSKLQLYKQCTGNAVYHISELGIITHKDPFDNDN